MEPEELLHEGLTEIVCELQVLNKLLAMHYKYQTQAAWNNEDKEYIDNLLWRDV